MSTFCLVIFSICLATSAIGGNTSKVHSIIQESNQQTKNESKDNNWAIMNNSLHLK
jgi:hypothetical protein